MKKKIWLSIAVICLLLVLAAVLISANRPALQCEMGDMLHEVEAALGDGWKKQTETKVSDLAYSDDKGNTIIYYVCVTTYYDADPAGQTGLNTDAISAVILPDEAVSCRECTVSGLPAAIYQKDGRAYLCWTILPELSCVIEYDPAVQSEEEILQMAESIPANTAMAYHITGGF